MYMYVNFLNVWLVVVLLVKIVYFMEPCETVHICIYKQHVLPWNFPPIEGWNVYFLLLPSCREKCHNLNMITI